MISEMILMDIKKKRTIQNNFEGYENVMKIKPYMKINKRSRDDVIFQRTVRQTKGE